MHLQKFMKTQTNSIPDIPVVCYHSIGPIASHWNRNFLTLELPYFEDQIRFISKHYDTIFLKEYWEMRSGVKQLNEKALVITLDDGFLDNWIWAYPILKKYNVRATIFVCPEFVDASSSLRPNLDDYRNNKVSFEAIHQWGYLNWNEMREMIASGFIDIQSHTMSHTKYFISDKLIGFHHPGNDCLYPVGNLYPALKPYHISDSSFEKQLPFGYPLFEEISSVCARIHSINPVFIKACIDKLKDVDFTQYSFHKAFTLVENIYHQFQKNNELIIAVEEEENYKKRLEYEIAGSKIALEKNLNKPIEFLCWPHGDNSHEAHAVAMKAGYLATTTGSKMDIPQSADRIPDRIGLFKTKNSRFLSLLKAKYKLGSFKHQFPYYEVSKMYELMKRAV